MPVESAGSAAAAGRPSAVVVCTASMDRAPLLRACVDSLLAGERPPDELLRRRRHQPVARRGAGGLAARGRCGCCNVTAPVSPAARNVGIAASSSDVVAFLDDDATADPAGWLRPDRGVRRRSRSSLGAGGPVLPHWGAERRWMPDELLWVVGCTYAGHRQDAGPIRNPIGCNMAFRRRELTAASAASRRASASAQGRCRPATRPSCALRLERAHGPGSDPLRARGARAALVPAARVSWRLLFDARSARGWPRVV